LGLTSKKNEALTAEALTAQKRSGWVVARCGIFLKIYIYFFSIFKNILRIQRYAKVASNSLANQLGIHIILRKICL
jgi:hypothetical protein